MIALRVLVLLGLAAVTMAQVYTMAPTEIPPPEPDCSTCEYNDNIGYVASEIYCQVYYVCYRNPHKPDSYKYTLMCCDYGLRFNPEHLTCDFVYDYSDCTDGQELCPIVDPIGYFPCPYKAGEDDKSFINKATHQVFNCSLGTVWDQEVCGCKFGAEYHERDPYCTKILSFDFEDDFNSEACNGNFASGVPHGDAVIAGETLCLDGHGDFLAIPYLNNFFAWNPIGHTFTLCFWFKQQTLTYGQGLFSTNCGDDGPTFISIYLEDNIVKVAVSGTIIETTVAPSESDYISVCVVFDNGNVYVYVNGNPDGSAKVDAYPINNQYAATLGLVKGYEPFKGYFDDFCFWTEANAQYAIDHYNKSYSNDNYSIVEGVEGE
jgi:hypothetical protein